MDRWSFMALIFPGNVISIPLQQQLQRHQQPELLQPRPLPQQQISECDWPIGKVNLDIIFIQLVDRVAICYS